MHAFRLFSLLTAWALSLAPLVATTLEPETRVLVRRAEISWVPPEGWSAFTPQELGIEGPQLSINLHECYPRFSGPGANVTVEVEDPVDGETIDNYAARRNNAANRSRFLSVEANRRVFIGGMDGYRVVLSFTTPMEHGAAAARLLRYHFRNLSGRFVTVTAKTENNGAMKSFAYAFEASLALHRLRVK